MTIHYLIYRPLKYKDDGRDIVSFLDFITIHMTFPAINAWISYQFYFTLCVTFTTLCSTTFFTTDQRVNTDYCNNYLKLKDGSEEKYTYFYGDLMIPSEVAFILLFIEASINITYYKDCVFGICVFMTFVGMLWVQEIQRQNDTLFNEFSPAPSFKELLTGEHPSLKAFKLVSFALIPL